MEVYVCPRRSVNPNSQKNLTKPCAGIHWLGQEYGLTVQWLTGGANDASSPELLEQFKQDGERVFVQQMVRPQAFIQVTRQPPPPRPAC